MGSNTHTLGGCIVVAAYSSSGCTPGLSTHSDDGQTGSGPGVVSPV